MIARYTRPGMGAVWSEENRFRKWLAVETAAAEVLAEHGEVPTEAARAIRQGPGFLQRWVPFWMANLPSSGSIF